MASFRMRIAGKTAAVTSLFESTPAYFRAYLTDAEEDFPVTVTHEAAFCGGERPLVR